uniref:Small ribosomal subunit protein uS17 n=1 Tax=Otolemur garnettii TaxID=30611 RepID=H0Y154_OTOGA
WQTFRQHKAYQKQLTIFQNKKRVLLGILSRRVPWVLNRGFFKTPQDAEIETFLKRCRPFTGNVYVQGWILSHMVTKMKMQRTMVILQDYLHSIHKYNGFEKCHKNMSVHLSPCLRDNQIINTVTVGECWPLNSTVTSSILKQTQKANKHLEGNSN